MVSHPEQVILESDPYRRLSYTWHTFSPEWAAAHGIDEEAAAAWRAEPRSKVAFDIEEVGQGVVKLTVVHDGFDPGSGVLEGIAHGWPAVVSSLKTLLETGSALPSLEAGFTRAAGHSTRPVVGPVPARPRVKHRVSEERRLPRTGPQRRILSMLLRIGPL